MDKRSILGFLLIMAVVFYWQFTRETAKLAERQKVASADSLKQVEAQAEIAIGEDPTKSNYDSSSENIEQAASSDPYQEGLPSDEQQKLLDPKEHGAFSNAYSPKGFNEAIVIENEKMKVGISPLGGGIQFVELKEYKTYDSLPIVLFDANDKFDLSFLKNTGNRNRTSFSKFAFTPSKQGFSIEGENRDDLTMTLNGEGNQKFEINYSLKGNTYDLIANIESIDLESTISSAQPIFFNWEVDGKGKEKSLSTEKQYTSLNFKYKNEEPDDLTRDDEEQIERKLQWASFKQYFFSALVYSEKGFKSDYGRLETQNIEDESLGQTLKFNAVNLALPIERSGNGETSLEFYFGPNHFQILEQYERQYEEVIDLGWGIFGWMNEKVVIPIFNWLNKSIASYGLIILILTLIIKLALSPLTYKNYLSSAKQKVLKPEVEEINKKFKDGDAVKKQQAMMALYKKTGVNPMAGCIPMIIQLPILYAMFRFFPSSIELRQKSFLWADDLSSYDSIFEWTTQIPGLSAIYGNHISLFTLLMAASTLIYTRMNSSQMAMPTQPGMPNMKVIMYIFPFMMLFFFNKFASGLSYYYLLANIFSMGQMFVIKNYVIDEDKIRKQIATNKKKPTKKSKFAKRLEDMAKQRGVQMPKK